MYVIDYKHTRQIEYKAGLDMRGYEVVRSQYFSTTQNPAMTIADGKLCFNTACLKKFENVEYVELLLNSVNRCIAVRPCDGNNPNALHWGKLREGGGVRCPSRAVDWRKRCLTLWIGIRT